jgi:hypothetical protein
MKTKLLIFTLLIFFLFGCESRDQANKEEENSSQSYPVDIGTSDYELTGFYGCGESKKDGDTVYLISSPEGLPAAAPCANNAPGIDWSKYSLLIAWSERCNADSEVVKKKFQQISENAYHLQLSVNPNLNLADSAAPLVLCILAPKLPESAQVVLSVILQGKENDEALQGQENGDTLKNSAQDFVNPYREAIIGKWKLIQSSTVYNFDTQHPEIVDCASDNITYDFLTSNQLEVSGGAPNDLAEGKHFYRYQKLNVGILSLPGPNLTVDGNNQLFCFARADDDIMTIRGEKITGRLVDETGLVVEQGVVATWTKTFIKLRSVQ